MPTINEMRMVILKRYSNATPLFREIIATGPTRRVVAIYESLLKRGEIDGESCYINYKAPHQIDMFEYMASLNEKGNTTNIKVEG